MQMEPTYQPIEITDEILVNSLRCFNVEWGKYGISAKPCKCGRIIYSSDREVRVKSYTSEYGWWPQSVHNDVGCYLDEADLQAECQGPTRKLTGVYIGCENCEPYVFLAETRDSAYLYGVQFDDFEYEVYDGEERLDGVLEVKVGVGGYIIQVRQTPETHFCPCYLANPDENVSPEVCRAYIPGNDFRVEEVTDAS